MKHAPPATKVAPAAAVTTTHAPAPAPHNPFVALLAPSAAPVPDANPFVALLASARAEADAGPSERARREADWMQFTGETRIDAYGRRQHLVVCGMCRRLRCDYSRWVTD